MYCVSGHCYHQQCSLNRTVTALLGEVHKAQDENLDRNTLSVNSKHNGGATKTLKGKQYLNNNVEKITWTRNFNLDEEA